MDSFSDMEHDQAFDARGACSPDAHPSNRPVTTAGAPGENRLVVIILRGGMDGLSVVQPWGDPAFAGWRPGMERGCDLDGFFALHPQMSALLPLWQAGELGFVHAVSTPYRDRRSHFDGQDLLEAGTVALANGSARDGWLNRLVQTWPGANAQTAFGIGRSALPLLDGAAPVSRWAPKADMILSAQALHLTRQLAGPHPLFDRALSGALNLMSGRPETLAGVDEAALAEALQAALASQIQGGRDVSSVASYAAERLKEDTRIAALSINGWDTHANIGKTLRGPMQELVRTILTLKQALGALWEQTTIVAITEFGRTAALNGTRGTDHGTGGAMVLAGGALRGGQVWADWPGLQEADLYDRRDLRPTRDLRAYLAWLLHDLFGTDRHALETAVFPGLDMGERTGLLR